MKVHNFLTIEDIVRLLQAEKGAEFITIVAETKPKVRKTGNPYKEIVKRSVVNGMINYNYEGNVNREREREGLTADFKASAPAWGTRVGNSCIIEHKGKKYIDFRLLNVLDTEYIADGKKVNIDDIKDFLPKRKSSGRQGVEKEIKVCRYSLDSIKEIRMNGYVYKVA